MNVLYLVTTQRPFFAEKINELEKQGITADVLPVPGHGQSASSAIQNRSLIDYVKYYPKVLSKSLTDYDLVHANFGLMAPFALAQLHRPIILTLWGSDLSNDYSWVSKYCAPKFDAVIVRSEEMKQKLSCDAHVIPSGVNTNIFKPMLQDESQQKVGWATDEKHILFPYSQSRWVKNYPLAEEVHEQVSAEIPGKVNLQTIDNISHDMVPVYMNAADALLLTSHREGSPNTIKEALSCNLPVISTDVGDARERLSHVNHSYVCKSEKELVDSLAAVLSEGQRSNGRETVDEVSSERMVERIVDIYMSVL